MFQMSVKKELFFIMKRLLIASLFLSFVPFASACQKINQHYLDPEVILSSGARDLGVKVIDARAVKSGDFKNFYFVQYKMQTPQNGVVYPMFAMNKPFEMGVTVYAMDDLAVALSGLGDGRRTQAKFSSSDDGYSRASRCLK